jgi:hypothetical protein
VRLKALTVSALLALPTVGQPQSLGEAAKQEAERRRKVQSEGPAAPVIDEQALNKAGPARTDNATSETPSVSPVPAVSETDGRSGTGAAGSARAPSTNANDLERERAQRARDERMWRERVAAATARVEQARAHYNAVKDMTLAPGQAFVDRYGRAVVQSPEHLQRIVTNAKAELDAAEKALADLLETARRDGIPPGWLR